MKIVLLKTAVLLLLISGVLHTAEKSNTDNAQNAWYWPETQRIIAALSLSKLQLNVVTENDRKKKSSIKELKSQQEFNAELARLQAVDPTVRHVSCMTYNVCNNPFPRALKNPVIRRQYGWRERLKRILKLIQNEKPHILALQEVRKDGGFLAQSLTALGYQFITIKNNDFVQSSFTMIAYLIKHLFLKKFNYYYTGAPGTALDVLKYGRPRAVLIATLYPTIMQQSDGQEIALCDESYSPIIVSNIHNGFVFTNPHAKIDANCMHVAMMNKFLKDHKQGIGLIVGDFNSVQDEHYTAEMKVFSEKRFCDLIEYPKTIAGTPVSGTFVGYSWDKYFKTPEAKKVDFKRDKFHGLLDHIFCKTIGTHMAYWSYVNTHRYQHGTLERPITKESDIFYVEGKEDRSFPSDHVPGIAHLLITEKKSMHSLKTDAVPSRRGLILKWRPKKLKNSIGML